MVKMDFSAGSDSKAFAYNAGDLGLIPGSGKSPGEGNGNLLQYSCLENPHYQRNLEGYSPWGCKELDMTERLTLEKSTAPRSNTLAWKIPWTQEPGAGYSPWGHRVRHDCSDLAHMHTEEGVLGGGTHLGQQSGNLQGTNMSQ